MIFTELRFFFFFALVFVLHWGLRRQWARKTWLLIASYLFYAAWDWRFLSLILFSTAVDYAVGIGLGKAHAAGRRRALVSLSVVTNLGLLGVFKYYDFFLSSLEELIRWFGFGWHGSAYAIILPVGISFYTFQTLSYSIDIYRRQLEPTHNLLDLALFVAFFPQLVAGPIVRARDFLPQLKTRNTFNMVAFRSCLVLLLVGFVKKAGISDNIAPFVDQYFANPETFNVVSAWIAVLFYAVQIYCDFSGYSDMAIAVGGLLGYQLGENFKFPYLAGSIQEFWQRWHISLSGWLRDYLYISLGGSRGSRLRTYRNLMLTMLLGGLWHGAAWTFVIWGGLHGAALALHRLLAGTLREWTKAVPFFGTLGTLLTFYWVCIAWIFFRAVSLQQALLVSRAFILLESSGERSLNPRLLIIFVVLAGIHWLASRKSLTERCQSLPDWGFAAAYGTAAALALALATRNAEPFIYFQF